MWLAGWTHIAIPILGRWWMTQAACWDPISSADTAAYAQLVAWMESRGRICRVGVEGTGSYGAGLTRHLTEAGIGVVEVNRPNRQLRRRRGKTADGPVEATRMLRVVHRSGVKARTQAANQIHALVVTAPEPVKDQLKGINLKARVKICARFRPGTDHTTTTHAKRALGHLPHRY